MKTKNYTFLKISLISLLLFALTACSALNALPLSVEQSDAQVVEGQTSAAPLDDGSQLVEIDFDNSQADSVLTRLPLAASDDLEANLIQLYQLANPSVVYIITDSGSGSGFVYDEGGHIITNAHVVVSGRRQTYEVVFADGERRQASLVGADVDSDLAVLQVEDMPEGITPLPLAADDSVQVGQFVVAIGNPFGEQGSMSLGIISGLGRSLPSQRALTTGSAYMLPDIVQTDAPINPGNSGGPLLNLQGEVVGVTSAIASDSGTSSGVGFSIPVKAVSRIIPYLIEDGEYEYAYMGAGFDGEITLSDETLYGLEQTSGVYVVTVSPGSPADEAGLVAANPETGKDGDLVTAINGQPIQDFADLNRFLIFDAQIGQTIQLTVVRDGRQLTLPLTLGSRP
jgi:S1-C subfamily serine protease